ncbi:MAG: type IV pili methyl-accepting chemotaxis transducer N-terminal domain-containing protein [Betaproteobacteria bacterium]|nr:type IV pili methyl-accepting chemotaxis transducer N-terminal domain-containing protein [Betaproteobacteria bacterium]
MIRIFSRQSVLGRLEIAMAILAFAATVSFVNLVVFAENSTGKASAINIAGSLRMQSYATALALADTSAAPAARLQAVSQAVREFDRRLNHPSIVAAISANPRNPLKSLFANLSGEWNQQLRPLVLQVAGQDKAAPEALARIHSFVGRVDEFVKHLDEALESQITTLKLIQGGMLFLMLITIFVAIFMLHEQLNATLSNMLRFAREVRKGDFSVRAPVGGGGEFAELSEAFNYMAEDLSRMYGTLEAQVKQKTAELERSNRALSLLYETARLLSSKTLTSQRLQQVLQRIEAEIGLPTVVICAFNPNRTHGYPIAVNAPQRFHPENSPTDCAECQASTETRLRPDPAHPGSQILNVPLVDAGHYFGTMPVLVPQGTQVDAWKIELLEAIGRQIGAALASMEHNQQEHRVALLEERSVIARELHDSLAQSLSYLKIQVTRLARLLDAQAPQQTHGVVDELRTGLNNAYRQLRELLTTFRLRFDGKGLDQALSDVVEEFRQRGLPGIEINNTLAGIELSANEQLHVLQIIREALSNVEHHAQTPQAWVTLARADVSTLCITIEDHGAGLKPGGAGLHHYGISIMRDRAESLGGCLSVSALPVGTRVELRFQPKMILQDSSAAELLTTMGGT